MGIRFPVPSAQPVHAINTRSISIFQALFCAVGRTSSNRNLVFVLSGDLVKALV